MVGETGAAPEALGRERREPDHPEVGVLHRLGDVLYVHAVAHASAAVDLDALLQLARAHQMLDVQLGKVRGVGADVPVVLEGDRPHAGPRRVRRHADHVLGAVHEIGVGVHVAVDGAEQQLVLDPRMDLGDLRVVLEHLVEVIVRPTRIPAASASAAKSHIRCLSSRCQFVG